MQHRKKLVVVFASVALLVVLLVAIRWAAPTVIKNYLNDDVLADLGDYRGSVDDVSLALWRGAMRVEGVRIEKVVGRTWTDFIVAPSVDITLSPGALFNRVVRVSVVVEEPIVNFVDGEEQDVQTGAGLSLDTDPDPDAESAFEFALEELQVRNGTIAFRNFISDPNVNLQLVDITIDGNHLVVVDGDDKRGALEFQAQFLGDSPLSLQARFDPIDYRTFMLAAELSLTDLTGLNEFFEAYADMDFARGEGNMVLELQAEDDRLTGYARPMLENVEVVDWEDGVLETLSEPFHLLRESTLGVILSALTHPESGEVATEVEFTGEVPETMDFDGWGAVFTMMRNAFIEAIDTDFEPETPLADEVAEDVDQAEQEMGEEKNQNKDEED